MPFAWWQEKRVGAADQLAERILSTACKGAGRAFAPPYGWGGHWMDRLIAGFLSEYPERDVIAHRPGRALPVAIGGVRKKEMVFDLLVAGWVEGTVRLTGDAASYPRLKAPVWAVESEVHTAAAEVLFDFDKLLLAAAPNRLLVTKHRRASNLPFTAMLRDAALGHGGGDIHVAYVPRFNEGRRARPAPEWLAPGGDVPYALHVIRGGEVTVLRG